jgi:hypothetical protein
LEGLSSTLARTRVFNIGPNSNLWLPRHGSGRVFQRHGKWHRLGYHGGHPSVLYAYDATNLATQLYNSAQAANGRDSFGQANSFNSPTVVAGKVFVPTRTGIAVFGLR